MKFGTVQERRFGSKNGAYSLVTDRENIDSQITLTDYEAELLIAHFGHSNIHAGNVQSNQELASKPFCLYPSGKTITLNVVFPKPEKAELRLYLSKSAGFKPNGGEVWFLFLKEGSLWIGAMPEAIWRSESSELKKDVADSFYQELLDEEDPVRVTKLKERDVYARDRKVALARMEQVGFSCEYDSNHDLFISRFSGRRYLEAHHLVPMGLQKEFNQPLDVEDNICCLCPRCHRAIHHAEEPVARDLLATLAKKRQDVLTEFQLDVPDLFSLYAIEEIV